MMEEFTPLDIPSFIGECVIVDGNIKVMHTARNDTDDPQRRRHTFSWEILNATYAYHALIDSALPEDEYIKALESVWGHVKQEIVRTVSEFRL